MNKKFSTLVAGLLLASSVGIAGVSAQTGTPVYSKFTAVGSAANSLQMRGAYQLTNADGSEALAMISTDGGKTFVLKMVSTADATKANLAETLWKIEGSSNVEGGPSFTFVSAAYDIPLSFNPAKADKDDLTNATEFPGTNSVWKWQPQIEAGAKVFAVEALKDNFSFPDSAMVLAAKAGKVGAVKYATKNGEPTAALKLMPKVVAAATLTADDLNSMLMTQKSGLMNLGFDKNVSEKAKNLWTNDYNAVKAIGENEINKAVVKAINAAVAAVDRASKGGAVADAIRAITEDYTDAGDIAIVEAVAAAAEAAANPTAAAAAATAELAKYTKAKTEAGHIETYAKAIQTAYGASLKQGTVSPSTIAGYKTAVEAIAETNSLGAEVVAAIRKVFIDLVPGKDTDAYVQPSASAVTDAVNVYTKAKEVATAAEVVATAAKDAGAAVTVDHTFIAKLITEMKADVIADAADAFDALADEAITDLATAVAGVKAEALEQVKLYPSEYENFLSLQVPDSDPLNYLRVDTTFLTGGNHLAFATGKFNAALKKSNGKDVDTYVQHDFNGRYNFQFTYFPTQDSLVIVTPDMAGYAHPMKDVKYADMTNKQIKDSWALHSGKGTGSHDAENVVKIAVLNDATNHREVTIGYDEKVEAANPVTPTTLNTRIYLLISPLIKADITPGVYTIKYISDDQKVNNRYLVNNYLQNGQAMAIDKEEIQNVLHIPAAQWVITNENGSNLNTILNRESGSALVKAMDYGNVQQQYLYKTATKNVYQNKFGDKFLLKNVTEDVNGDEYLGYFHATEADAETEANVYAFRYLNETEGLYITMNEDSTLRVSPVAEEGAEKTYLELEPVFDEAIEYGATAISEAAKEVATPLKRQMYRLRLITDNKNENDQDKLYVYSTVEGKYKFYSYTDDWADVHAYSYFMLKEFNEVDTCYYALIEQNLAKKVSVDDYPSNLVVESLEAQADYGNGFGYLSESRSSVFALENKEAPLYRRLGVTNAEDGLKNIGTNNAKINITRETGRYLYENSINKVAGYEKDSTGINYLGAQFSAEDAALFIDTAYVRGNTTRPQYMLAVRPDFTPALVDCDIDPTHPKHEIAQVRANYLVSLTDSVDAYWGDKNMLNKFMYENRTYTRLAFVDAIHRGDSLFIMDSKFKGTEFAKNDTINLSKNAFNEGAWQFRLTKNFDETAEFLIEGPRNGQFVRLVNGVAVLTGNVNDAERFNIATTDEKPTANDGINASEVSVIATDGAVIIKGAQGKKVAISNILGQTIANTVLSSDNATISAPAGVVVVAVEGEAAVKAIVK